jgi:hypothetical protein
MLRKIPSKPYMALNRAKSKILTVITVTSMIWKLSDVRPWSPYSLPTHPDALTTSHQKMHNSYAPGLKQIHSFLPETLFPSNPLSSHPLFTEV